MTRWSLALIFVLATPLFALAQPEAAAQHAETVAERPDEDLLEWNLLAGGVFNSGNTRSWSLNAGTHFGFVRGRHGLTLDWVLSYGRAALRDEDTGEFGDTTDVARNSNARIRYDFFLTDNDAIFAAVAHRWDTFAGLDTRLQAQIGYLRNFINEDNHRFWTEAGFDFTYDNFDPEDLVDADGNELRTDEVYSARLFLGYKNQLNEHVLFLTSLEGLLDLEHPADNLRLNYDAALQVTVVDSLQLGITFKLLYDQDPVQGRENVDTITTLNLIYSLI